MDALPATARLPACSSDPAWVATLKRQVIGSDYLFLIAKMLGTRHRRKALLEQRGYGGEMWLARAVITFAAALD
jgi:hypothetical protein